MSDGFNKTRKIVVIVVKIFLLILIFEKKNIGIIFALKCKNGRKIFNKNYTKKKNIVPQLLLR
jgi:hypothetical protein